MTFNTIFTNSTQQLASSNAVFTGSVSAGTGMMFRNAIVNGCMRFNQRGTSTSWASPAAGSTDGTAGNTRYVTDRWAVRRNNWQTGSICNHGTDLIYSDLPTSEAGIKTYARFGRTNGNAGVEAIWLAMALETQDSYRFAGQSVTLSFYYRTGANFSGTNIGVQVLYGTGTDEASQRGVSLTGGGVVINVTVSASTTWQRTSFIGTVPSTSTQLAVRFYYTPSGTAGASEYIDVTGVQLERGSVATPFEFRPYGVELQLCQRYYEVDGVGPNHHGFTYALGSYAINEFYYRVTKRTTAPTILYTVSSGSVTSTQIGQNFVALIGPSTGFYVASNSLKIDAEL